MSRRPRYTRKDNTHAPIVAALRELGMVVMDIADLPGKRCDLVVSWRGVTLPVEVKDIGKRDDLTDGELEYMQELNGVDCRLVVAESAEEVVRAFEAVIA